MAGPIVIFGATGGMGEAIARRVSAAGLPAFLVARDADRLASLADALDAGHAVCDMTDLEAVARTVECAAGGGPLGGLVYAVGSIVLKPIAQVRPRDFTDAFDLNLVGAAEAVRAGEKALRAGKGSVLLFSTVAVQQGFPFHAVIAAAKGAVEGLTRALAADLAPDVRVNCIAPSLTRTPLAARILRNDATEAALAKLHPLGRLGEADDIAMLAETLLRPEGFVTGQIIHVDGGRGALRLRD